MQSCDMYELRHVLSSEKRRKLSPANRACWSVALGTLLLAFFSSPAFSECDQSIQPDEAIHSDFLSYLALSLDGAIVVKAATYCTLLKHLSVARRLVVADEAFAAQPRYDGRSIELRVSSAAAQAIASGTYSDWNELHSKVQLASVRVNGRSITIAFASFYNTPELARSYSAFSGIEAAEPNLRVGDASSIYVTRDGHRWHYVVDLAKGDCPAGCHLRELHYLVAETQGEPSVTGKWSGQVGDALPDWAIRYWQARRSVQ